MHNIDHGGVLERFEHEALIYRNEADYLASTVPFIEAGLAAGEPVMVAVPAIRVAALRRALPHAGDAVTFADMESLGANPGRIIPAWVAFVAEHPGPARGIGEPIWPSRPPEAVAECVHHEALLNLALADAPDFRLLCPYDGAALPAEVIDDVDTTHRHVHADGRRSHSARFPTHAPIPIRPPDPLPPAPPSAERWQFGARELRQVRERIRQVGTEVGLTASATDDLALAVHEIAANSVEHGGGRGTLRTWLGDWSLVVEITDRGHIGDPLIGRRPPDPARVGGRGLWMAQQLCDLMQMRTTRESGTTVRLHASRR
jgi:anti-sigma regulatory factor (Ser/Thr protein kinase)